MKCAVPLALGILFSVTIASQTTAQQFVFMGDSLVDNQNSFLFTSRLKAALPVTGRAPTQAPTPLL